jgi:hypothetical protein
LVRQTDGDLVNRYVETLITKLRAGEITDALLWDVEDALRMARRRNYRASCPELNDHGVTKAEAKQLHRAVYLASRSYLDLSARLPLLLICVRDGDRRVVPEVEGEMARLAMSIRHAGGALYQALSALTDVGVGVFPSTVTSIGVDSYKENMDAAIAYLGKRGLLGPSVRAAQRKREGR